MEIIVGIVILGQFAMNVYLVHWIVTHSANLRVPKAVEPKKELATFGGAPYAWVNKTK